MRGMLESHGAVCPPLILEFVEAIKRNPEQMGKLKLIMPAGTQPGGDKGRTI